MSQNKRRKAAFFKEHPYCCFCAGSEIATTEDHIPGRTIFENKAWPEGFVFPACKKCNSESSDNEVVVALLARLGEKSPTRNQEVELQSKLYEFTKQFPELRQQIKSYSRNEEKRIISSFNMHAWNVETNQQRKAITLPSEMLQHAEKFGIKLGKALHYLHTKNIIHSEAKISCKGFTNADMNLFPDEAITKIINLPSNTQIVRSSKPLVDQFVYRYIIDPKSLSGVYIVAFGGSSILLFISIETSPGLLNSI